VSTLHIVSGSPFGTDCLQRCLAVYTSGDTLLLIQSGVYLLQQAELLPADVPVYVLSEDLRARGLAISDNCAFVATDYSGFVALVCEHSNCVSWR
jgi:tRNA 2-thiouridine synthesizing protein B